MNYLSKAAQTVAVCALCLRIAAPPAQAGGCTYRSGVTAGIRGIAGAGVAWIGNSADALAENPAALSRIDRPNLALSLTAVSVDGDFTNSAGSGETQREPYIVPDAAYSQPIGDSGFVVGAGVSPSMLLGANWTYPDPVGAGGASYGVQRNESEFSLLRPSIGGAYGTERLAVGATLGVVYNHNQLRMPYIFQSHPGLSGLKTLLDLETSGYDVDGCFGVLLEPADSIAFGATYKTSNSFSSTGSAAGDLNAQFAALGVDAPSDFRYDARVLTNAPRIAAVGLAWKPADKLQLAAQFEWMDWSAAMPGLPIFLTDGSNAAVNGLLSSTSLDDNVAFLWKDRFVYRLGGQYSLSDSWSWRSGYAYSPGIVPSATLTPVTADITEHMVALGLGYSGRRGSLDFAYQWDLPKDRNVSSTVLAGGEYAGSQMNVGIHWITVSSSLRF